MWINKTTIFIQINLNIIKTIQIYACKLSVTKRKSRIKIFLLKQTLIKIVQWLRSSFVSRSVLVNVIKICVDLYVIDVELNRICGAETSALVHAELSASSSSLESVATCFLPTNQKYTCIRKTLLKQQDNVCI